MKTIQVKDIVAATGGTLLCGEETISVDHVITDSREAKEGSLFVPIIGERVDAHRFIPDVMKAGASATFTSDASIRTERGACILVEDTLAAMQALAAWYRSQFDIPIIGVTGSVGKTTTKEMISAVLSTKYRVLKTKGNWNSQIGVAQMMFMLEDEIELAVIEMGMSMPGEMARLVEMAKPQTAVMTNVGVSHIGNLGSRENIAKEKGHIVKYVGTCEKDGFSKGAFYVCGNGDLYEMSQKEVPFSLCEKQPEVIFYGTEVAKEAEKVIRGTDMKVTGSGQSFTYQGTSEVEVELSVMGGHNVNNAIIAMALGEQFGVPTELACQALKEYHPFSMRGERKDCHGYHVIDDTYNASPDSINSNISALFDYEGNGRKIVALGDVLELGEQMEALHRGIGDYILKEAGEGRKLAYVITVGEAAAFISDQVQKHSDIPVKHCKDNEEVAAWIQEIAQEGDWILVKGSRGMHMDEVVEKVVM